MGFLALDVPPGAAGDPPARPLPGVSVNNRRLQEPAHSLAPSASMFEGILVRLVKFAYEPPCRLDSVGSGETEDAL